MDMAKAPNPHPNQHLTLGNGFHAIRPIAVHSIGALLGNLKQLADKDKPRDTAVHVGVKNPESGPAAKIFARGFLNAMHLHYPEVPLSDVYDRIKSLHPSVNRRIEHAAVKDVDVWKSGDNIYVGAEFNKTTAAKLRAEQDAMLEIAAKLGEGDLDEVRAFQPDAIIAVVGANAVSGTVSEVMDIVEKQLPTKIELLPVTFSHQLARSHAARSGASSNRFATLRAIPVARQSDVKGEADRAMVRPEDFGVDVGRLDLVA